MIRAAGFCQWKSEKVLGSVPYASSDSETLLNKAYWAYLFAKTGKRKGKILYGISRV
jgi:hypothetical protein